jgi:two-component system, chemotaxis family, chemotaxis protein CheY
MTSILIIDDTAEDRKRAEVVLSSAGYGIIGRATGGEEGIQLYRNLKPDMVLVDVIMQGINGIDTLRAIRMINPRALIILCTSIGRSDVVALAMRNGANAYVVKPYDPEILINSIRRIMERPIHQ